MIDANRSEAYVVDDDSAYIGVLTLNQIVANGQSGESSGGGKARDHARDDSLCFSGGMSVWDAMEAMQGLVGESILVVGDNGRLLGIVYESTLLKAYLQIIHRLRAEAHAAQ